ncbi:hypothetical protein, partial [Actinomyces oris]|uniref:hypothetical protein n=1 Tax=Actinomyces oris TaxID=544580 RepID=UPI0028526B9B
SPNQPQTQSARTQSQYNSPENQTRPNPTPTTKEMRARQTKTKQPQKPHTTKIMRSPQGHGIKNMTHYRVLKQHTQPELNQAF